MTITANFLSGLLQVTGDAADNSITASRDLAGNLLVNGGAVAISGGASCPVANTRSEFRSTAKTAMTP